MFWHLNGVATFIVVELVYVPNVRRKQYSERTFYGHCVAYMNLSDYTCSEMILFSFKPLATYAASARSRLASVVIEHFYLLVQSLFEAY